MPCCLAAGLPGFLPAWLLRRPVARSCSARPLGLTRTAAGIPRCKARTGSNGEASRKAETSRTCIFGLGWGAVGEDLMNAFVLKSRVKNFMHRPHSLIIDRLQETWVLSYPFHEWMAVPVLPSLLVFMCGLTCQQNDNFNHLLRALLLHTVSTQLDQTMLGVYVSGGRAA